MKHIRKYNEEADINDIIKFCNSHLVPLFDNGYKVEFFKRVSGSRVENIKVIEILITFIDYNNFNKGLEWSDIRIDFLPFLEMLIHKYKIIPSVGRSAITGKIRNNIVEINGQNIIKEQILDDEFVPSISNVRFIKINIERSETY